MSDDQTTTQPSELDELKTRADTLGITYHPNIGLDKLREKVNTKLSEKTPANDSDSDDDTGSDEDAAEATSEPKAAEPSANEQRLTKRQEASKLVRVQVTCMNPNKREWEGEVFSCGNRIVGTHKKYVPFDTEWHVPQVILNMIQQRKCQVFVTEKDDRGRSVRRGKLIKEFSVEVLPQLTKAELKALAQRQAMANGTAAA